MDNNTNTLEEVEIWKPVVGYEGIYEVSSKGSVRSLDRHVNGSISGSMKPVKGVNLNPCLINGYSRVVLTKNGEAKKFFVHRIVANSFIENPGNKKCVNHKDFDRSNNKVSNLEWCTNKENSEHASVNKRYKSPGENSIKNLDIPKCKRVKVVNVFTGEDLQFDSIKAFAEHIGASRSSVNHSIRRKRPVKKKWDCKIITITT